jgi:DNA-binding response OmpR family regulator
MTRKILLIEDDKETALTIKEELKRFSVDLCFTVIDGETKARVAPYDLIILDLGLPDKDGLEVCKKIRKERRHVPILILTGESDTKTKVALLDSGADDYVTKPFSTDELKARIRAMLRRKYKTLVPNMLMVQDLILDLNRKYVWRGETEICLRRKEYQLLLYLVRNAGKVVSRSMILQNVWSGNSVAGSNVVDVHIKYLRDKIDKPFIKKLIQTSPGMGYMIEK